MYTKVLYQTIFFFLENENTSDDSVISNDKNHGKYSDIYDGLGYPIKDDKYKKKNYQIRAYSSRYNNSSRLK